MHIVFDKLNVGKRIVTLLITAAMVCLFFANCAPDRRQNADKVDRDKIKNPLLTQQGDTIRFGDPFLYEHNGIYYLTGTSQADKGFEYYSSPDLVHWEYGGFLYQKKEDNWASDAFWAPEVFQYKERFYLIYSAFSKELDGLRLALAVSDSPSGPFTDLYAPLFEGGFGAIDGHVFVDKDQQPYLFFSKNGFEDGYSYGILYGMKLQDDLTADVRDTVKLLEASQDWERVNWTHNRCNEGATVFQYQDRYFMTYSANHTFEPHYGIGYAVADHPLGVWKKADENPIASKIEELNLTGIGHNSLLKTGEEGTYFIAYHTHADTRNPQNQIRNVNIGLLRVDRNGKVHFSPNTNPE